MRNSVTLHPKLNYFCPENGKIRSNQGLGGSNWQNLPSMVTIEHTLLQNFASKVELWGCQMALFHRYLIGLILAKTLGKKSWDMAFLVVTIGTYHVMVAKCLEHFLLTAVNSRHLCICL